MNFDEIRLQNKERKSIVDIPKPFMKWAGGKRQLLRELDARVPNAIGTYMEPFVGGGALFFYLLPKEAIIIDNNRELINAYKVIKNDVHSLIASLQQHENEKEYYYQIRNKDRDAEAFGKWTDVEKASRTIYMNRCCFNGLYRVNSKGQFNVPFGKYKNPKFCDKENLLAVHELLQNVRIMNAGFEKCLDFAREGDFLYLDPPYVPLSDTANFTGYTRYGFGHGEQQSLREVMLELDSMGCKVLMSNSYCKFILDLYKDDGFTIDEIRATRAINSDGSKRGKIKEVLIYNYNA